MARGEQGPFINLGEAVMEVNQEIMQAPLPLQKPTPNMRLRGPLPHPGMIGWALLAAFLLLVTWETGAALIQHWSAPTADDWASAAASIKGEHKAGEPVLFAPHWVSPLGRQHFGRYLTLETAALSDVARYPRVWLVSTRGANHPWLLGLEPAESKEYGAVTVDLYRKPPSTVTYDFTSRILDAQVERANGEQVTRCPRRDERFICPPQGWNWVGPHLAEVGHQPYRCIFAHAVDDQVMRVTFPAAPLGRSVVVYTGIDDFENRKRNDSPVTLRLLVGGKEVGKVTHRNAWPWHRAAFDTSKAAGQTHPVRFEVTTPQAFARTFCFSAEARK